MKSTFTEEVSTKSNKRVPFFTFRKGSNPVRIITAPHKSSRYVLNKQYINVPFGVELPTDAKLSNHWYVGVIDRKTQSTAILDFGPAIYNQIRELSKSEDWGSTEHYDIDIVCNPDGGADNYYRVMPKPKRPLSADDIQLAEQFDEADLEFWANPSEEVYLAAFFKVTGSNGVVKSAVATE